MMQPAIWLGVSLKMYFGYQQTLNWSHAVAENLRQHPAMICGKVGLFILPAFPALTAVKAIFADTAIKTGAQDICQTEKGAWTGEVSASMLAEIGCHFAEIGHAERRRHFFEDDDLIALKVAMALRHHLTPVLCLGEPEPVNADQAIDLCSRQLHANLKTACQQHLAGEVIVAYEPQWAIGAPQPAADRHIRTVCAGIKDSRPAGISLRVIYGGSAGPGLLQRLDGQVDGLFLGRFAHDPAALCQIVDEAAALVASSTG
ncbi:triose-phosphate isomerase [Erwinia sp. OLTSP20]|uniref:triose-phosphate isomerase family protein n=1 Tax=unclassified Erwinia TaxID=2622719 RepID=UPI000C18A382|nr:MULTISPECIES: triose-phosphate isomerase family protein [unclassified Erwinia]PIJ51573.1 triose-phosphate isomerase [Erwinia sp. OAMSP11]PIJ75841.1 triose-phosphate isomerase [Erwinia sp. OLSSP12]PIJ83483.1 triose-phosphate isomerase [Erwinia sp. OLCASP19]PIJ86316.1 triose-phosphate isomerase [Erwinia sp. OLMTSP26]PIJ88441.1 triose-phosphate isomerase [Erwinia sp. OLMDSP33]